MKLLFTFIALISIAPSSSYGTVTTFTPSFLDKSIPQRSRGNFRTSMFFPFPSTTLSKQSQTAQMNICIHKTRLAMSSEGLGNFSEISSALALLDSQWQQQQQQSPNRNSSWQKIIVPKEIDTPSSPEKADSSISEEFVYYLPPQQSEFDKTKPPGSVILFVGGAGLGQYPHITYNSLLTSLSQKCNAAILAAPYDVNLDHFDLAKRSGDLLRRSVILMEDGKLDSIHKYTAEEIADVPKYALCHSLGAKLQLIFMAATNSHLNLKGIGMMAYNNFGLAASIQMTQSFLNNSKSGGIPSNPMLNNIFQFAEQAVNTIGIDFTPSPSQMDSLITLKFSAEMQQKSRLFVFDDDDLDSSVSLLNSLSNQAEYDSKDLEVSRLKGTHLSPVFLKFNLQDLVEDEIKNVMGQFTNDFQQISWGNVDHLDALVEEIHRWMIGKPPTESSLQGNTGLFLDVVDAEIE